MKKYSFLLLASILVSTSIGCDKEKETDVILTEHDWEVEEIRLGDFQEKASDTYVLKFEENSFSLGLDVNQCGGDVEIIDDTNIRFFNSACTEACCDSEFAQNLIILLSTVKTYDLDSDELELEDGNDFIELKKK